MTAPESDQGSNGRTPGLLTESAFLGAVVDYAHLRGWLVHHDRPARTERGWRTAIQGEPGFPDLVLARRGVVILAELKGAKGRLTDWQTEWAQASGAFVWWPEDWPVIEALLR